MRSAGDRGIGPLSMGHMGDGAMRHRTDNRAVVARRPGDSPSARDISRVEHAPWSPLERRARNILVTPMRFRFLIVAAHTPEQTIRRQHKHALTRAIRDSWLAG